MICSLSDTDLTVHEITSATLPIQQTDSATAESHEHLLADLQTLLERFSLEVQAERVLLFHHAGHALVAIGDKRESQIQPLGALIAGAFQSAVALAALVGGPQFTTVAFEGSQHHVYIAAIEQTWHLVVFSRVPGHSGLIRLHIANYLPHIAEYCREIFQTPADDAMETVRSSAFQSSVSQQIDTIFQDVAISTDEES